MKRKVLPATAPLRHSRENAALLLGASVSTLDRLIASGQVRCVRTGARVYVLDTEVQRVLRTDIPRIAAARVSANVPPRSAARGTT
jgi:excisionase family DNA binding protein